MGIILFCIAILMMLVVVIKTLIWGDPVAGFTTLFTMVMFFGVFVGTYSSIFIASSFINTWHKKSLRSASRRAEAASGELETVEAK